MRVQILLSTYNGERYLREQLDSFLALEGKESIKILIRDDGSTDGTVDILREYRDRHGFSLIEGENIGLNRSVYELVRQRDKDCDFFAFSDQDDVWLPEKVARAASALSEISRDVPALYAGTSHLADEKLSVIGTTLRPRKPLSFYNAMVENVCIGHTLMMNAAAMDVYADGYSDGIFVFDYWAYMLVASVGRVVFDSQPTTLYRQHSNNVVGYMPTFVGKLKVRLRRVFAGKSYYNARQLKAFLDVYGRLIPQQYKAEAERFFRRQRNFFTRLCYIFSTKAYRQGRCEGLVFRLMYLFSRYNIKQS